MPEPLEGPAIELVAILFVIAAGSSLSALEAAVAAFGEVRLLAAKEEGGRYAGTAARLLDDRDHLSIRFLTGRTVALVLAVALAVAILARWMREGWELQNELTDTIAGRESRLAVIEGTIHALQDQLGKNARWKDVAKVADAYSYLITGGGSAGAFAAPEVRKQFADTAAWEPRVKTGKDGEPDFRGPLVHGKRGERFLYVSWGEPTGSGHEMFRRLKLYLGPLTRAGWSQSGIDSRMLRGGRQVVVRISGRASDGTPACGTAPANWRVLA